MFEVQDFILMSPWRPAQKGDIVHVRVVKGAFGRMKVMEWVVTPNGVIQRWLYPPDVCMVW